MNKIGELFTDGQKTYLRRNPKELDIGDKEHSLSLKYKGAKAKGILKRSEIFYAEDTGNTIHVVGTGKFNFDYWQAWIPKSIVHVLFGISQHKNLVWWPEWATIKIYPISQGKAEVLSKKVELAIREADRKRYIGNPVFSPKEEICSHCSKIFKAIANNHCGVCGVPICPTCFKDLNNMCDNCFKELTQIAAVNKTSFQYELDKLNGVE